MNIQDTLLCTLEHILSVHLKLGYLREEGGDIEVQNRGHGTLILNF